MANPDIKYGFEFYKNLYGDGPAQTIECEALAAYGTALFEGDAVIMATTGSDVIGRGAVTQAAASNSVIYGVIASISQVDGTLNTHAGAKSTRRRIQVIPALPGYLFTCNASSGVNPTDIGAMFDLVVGTGDTATGRSAMELNDTTATTGATLTLMGFVDRRDNAFTGAGSSTDTVGVDCIVNFHETKWAQGATLG